MAINVGAVWEVRTTGNDSNGGAFVAGSGTNRSQQDEAHVVFDGSAITAITSTSTSVIAVVGYAVSTADIGNILKITGGTNFTVGRYQITAINTGTNTWTLDRTATTAAGAGMSGRMGGAVASPGEIAAVVVAGNIAFVKAGTYDITTATTNVSGGAMNTSTNVIWVGYDTTRTVMNRDANRPTLRATTSGVTIWTGSSLTGTIRNFIFDGNLQTGAKATAGGVFIRCQIQNCNTVSSGTGSFLECSATANSAAPFTTLAVCCYAFANTATPFTSTAINCISADNTGATTDGFSTASGFNLFGCVAYANGRDGIFTTGGGWSNVWNCISVNNGRYGYTFGASNKYFQNCAHFGNATAATNGTSSMNDGMIALATDPFVNAAGGDFSLKPEAAALFGSAYPSAIGSTPNYGDIGPAQSFDSGGGVKKNTALNGFTFLFVDSTDHLTPKTGLTTVVAERSIDGASFTSCTNSVSEVSNGVYKIDLSASDLNGNSIMFKFTSAGADPRYLVVVTHP